MTRSATTSNRTEGPRQAWLLLLWCGILASLLLPGCATQQTSKAATPNSDKAQAKPETDSQTSVVEAAPDPEPEPEPTRSPQARIGSSIRVVAVAPDRARFAVLCANGRVLHWDALSMTQVGEFPLSQDPFDVLAYGPGGLYAYQDSDGVHVRAESGASKLYVPASEPVLFLRFDESGERLLVPQADGNLQVWNLTSQSLEHRIQVEQEEVAEIRPGPGFSILRLVSDEKLRLMRLRAGGLDKTLEVKRQSDSRVVVAEDGSAVATVSPDGQVEVRSVPEGELVRAFSWAERKVPQFTLSPDATVLAAIVPEEGIELWEVSQGELLEKIEAVPQEGSDLTFTADGLFVVWVEDKGNSVRCWSPVEKILEMDGDRVVVEEQGRSVCTDLAATIRYGQAQQPFARGLDFLRNSRLEEARREFEEARAILGAFPGLAAASDEAERRYQALLRSQAVAKEVQAFETRGDYYAALSTLEAFTRDFPEAAGPQHREHVERLRNMLQHYKAAEAHREAGRDLDAVEEFERAALILPDLKHRQPQYGELRASLTASLVARAHTANEQQQFDELVKVLADLKRLRPLDTVEKLRLGDAHAKLGQRKSAEDAYSSIPEGDPEYGRARWRLGRLVLDDGQLQQAKAEFELARQTSPSDAELETDFAELYERLDELDAAVQAWSRVAELAPAQAQPFERIGAIHESLERWSDAATALRKAVRRSSEPRPNLLLKLAELHSKVGDDQKVLQAYLDLLELLERDVEMPWLGERPNKKLLGWIRDLGFVRHRDEWIPRRQFLAEQGWVRRNDEWIRPDIARLREVVDRQLALQTEGAPPVELRRGSDEEYQAKAQERRLTRGMNRREVIQAWGFFSDQNVSPATDGSLYEQLLYPSGRQVYLRDGLVCFWSE